MFVITVKFTTYEKDTEKFKTRILKQAKDSIELELGCLVFDVCHDPKNINIVFFVTPLCFIICVKKDTCSTLVLSLLVNINGLFI